MISIFPEEEWGLKVLSLKVVTTISGDLLIYKGVEKGRREE